VSTDNHAGGKMGAEELLKLLNGKGKVILLRAQEGTASTTAREEGFLEEIRKHPDIQILVDNRYAGATAAEAQTTAMNMLDKIRQADGMFCPNEGTAFGALLALRQAGIAGKIKLVGFDTSPSLIEGLKKGEIQALVAQHPKKMAYEAVKLIVAKIHGEDVPQKVDSGAELITAENLDTPEIQKLLTWLSRLSFYGWKACESASGQQSRWTVSICRCGRVRCWLWLARTEPARAH